jgi:NAD(P)H-dependent FMN reductase
MVKLHIVVVSTRAGRVGPSIAAWFEDFARQQGQFDIRLVDLAEVNLPLFDEPAHPRLKKYQNEHTKRWSAIVSEADAFAFVTPEYNYGTPPSLVNALDYVFHEWHYKPVCFVSYGGQSGGIRSVQMVKPMMTTLRMMPIPEAVAIPFFAQHRDDRGKFTPTEAHEKAADNMLKELGRWAEALKPLRA